LKGVLHHAVAWTHPGQHFVYPLLIAPGPDFDTAKARSIARFEHPVLVVHADDRGTRDHTTVTVCACCDVNVTVANMPGRSEPSGFASSSLTFAVRVAGSSTWLMFVTRA